jgi:hypothetical protein
MPKKKVAEETVKKKKKAPVEEEQPAPEDEEEQEQQNSGEEENGGDEQNPRALQRSRSMTSPNVIEGGAIDISKKKRSLFDRLGFGSKKIDIKKAPQLPPAPEADVLNKMFAKLLVSLNLILKIPKKNSVFFLFHSKQLLNVNSIFNEF